MQLIPNFDLDRGEAANHGIYDAAGLVYQLLQWRENGKPLEQAIQEHQAEVEARTHTAVLLSRYACLECHDLPNLTEKSKVFQVSGFNAGVKTQSTAYDFSSLQSMPSHKM